MKFLVHILVIIALGLFPACKRMSDGLEVPSGQFSFHYPPESSNWQIDSLHSDFALFVKQIENETDSNKKQILADSFMQSAHIQGIPLIEQEILAHFLYQDSTEVQVELIGDFNKWSEKGYTMQKLKGTNLYSYSARFPAGARLEYKLRVNGILIRDPLNPNCSCYGDFSRNSELRMPFYVPQPEIESYDIPHGNIKVLQYYDSNRIIRVYLPPEYPASNRLYPCAYFHDGSSYLSPGMAQHILDYLIHYKKIKPIIAVFIDPLSRDDEYYYGYPYMDTFVNQIIPYVEKNFACDHKAENRAIVGYSLGALSALLFARHHSDVFGHCAAFSPAIFTGDILEQYENAPALPVKFYIDAGTFEDWIYTPTLELATMMAGKNYNGRFYTWYEYHSMCSWRAHLDEALIYFYENE